MQLHSAFTSPRAARTALAAVLVLAACALLLPTTSSAAKIRVGVHAQNDLTANEIERMARGGVEVVRMIFRWSEIEPTSASARNFQRYDAIMRTAATEGVDILPIIVGIPAWARDPEAVSPETGLEAWPLNADGAFRLQLFIEAIVQRYGHDGTFFAEHPLVPEAPLNAYQLWNEPNRQVFSPGGRSRAADYAELLKASAATIRRTDSRAKVVLAGMPERTTTSKPLDVYLKNLYKAPKVKQDFDIMTLHPYGVDEKGVEGAVKRLRSQLKRLGDKNRKLWITEVGWGSGGNPSPFRKKAAEQARLLEKTFNRLEKRRKKYRIGTAIWFSWRDRLPPGNSGEWQEHTGLFEMEGEIKPAWTSFTKVSGGEPGKGDLRDGLGLPLRLDSTPAISELLPELLPSQPAN